MRGIKATGSGSASGLAGLVVVEAGYQGSATEVGGQIDVNWRWAIDDSSTPTRAYFNSSGVTAGQEAILAFDPATGKHYLVPATVI